MKKVFEVTITKGNVSQSFVLGAKILDKKGKETEIFVEGIENILDIVTVRLSDGNTVVFHGFPYTIVKK